jgi:hypothetical protein
MTAPQAIDDLVGKEILLVRGSRGRREGPGHERRVRARLDSIDGVMVHATLLEDDPHASASPTKAGEHGTWHGHSFVERDEYFIASLKHTSAGKEHIDWWQRNESGYTPVLGDYAGRYSYAAAIDMNDGLDCIAVPAAAVLALATPEPYALSGRRFYDQRGPVVENTRANWAALLEASIGTGRKHAAKPKPFRGRRQGIHTESGSLVVDAQRYPLDPFSIGEHTYCVISRGHHDIHAFMAKVRESWQWPLGVPKHIWMKTMPAPSPEYTAWYQPVPEGTRGAWPCTHVHEAYNEDAYENHHPDQAKGHRKS